MVYIFGNKKFEELTEADIQLLITRHEEENIILEFKKELVSNSKEIAKDISSMSNSEGGIIIYGLVEDGDGKASSIEWINSSGNVEERIESIIATTINPISTCKIFSVPKQDDSTKKVFLLLIPKSNNLHMVIKDSDNRYYKRSGRTIQRMEDSEIKIRIRSMALADENLDLLLDSLTSEFHENTGTNLDSINRIHYFVVPNELHKKVETIDELKDLLGGITNPLSEGQDFPTYGGNIANSRFINGEKWLYATIVHSNGIVEFRRSGRWVEIFASSVETPKLITLINFTNEFYKKLNYFGGYKICIEIGNLGRYGFHETFSNSRGLYEHSVGKLRKSIEIDSLLVQEQHKNNLKILELIKTVGGTVGVSGEGAYQGVKQILGLLPPSSSITILPPKK